MRNRLQNFLPEPKSYARARWFRLLGQSRLLQPDLWYLNRYNVARGLAVGLFVAMLPVPGQTIFAALIAVLLRANLPIAVVAVWFTNPLTVVPIFYVNYLTGQWIIELLMVHQPAELASSALLWQPLALGSLITGALLATLAYFVVLVLWRAYVRLSWRNRRRMRQS